jgi:SOS-response transcriptional repressor LexA
MKRLGETVLKRMRELNLTYNEVARRAGISAVYVSGICRGLRFPRDEVAVRLAKALDLSPRALVELARYAKAPAGVKPLYDQAEAESPENLRPVPLNHAQQIPVAGWVQAGKFVSTEGVEVAGAGAEEWVYSDIKGKNLFALRVENDSMEPLFHAGDYLIVNPNLKPVTGDYVIAKLPSEGKATFKKLVQREGLIILRPLNPAYEDIVLTPDDEFEILGKVVERKTIF